jgi:hypothetical protein
MDILTKTELTKLLIPQRGPCVSLFMPAHRKASEQDPIRGKNLLRSAEEKLLAAHLRGADARSLLAPARRLFEDDSFWKNQSDGLACFLAHDVARFYRLPLAFPEMAAVAPHFHLKPLLPLLAGNGRFYVLAISQNYVRLLQGTAFGVDRVDLKGVPTNLSQAMQFHDRDEPLNFHTRPTGAGRWARIFNGQGVGIDDFKDDLLRYFQQIDRGLHELLRTERIPLILASVEYLWPLYRQANTYPHLSERGIAGSPDRLSDKELHEQGWAILQPQFQQAQRDAAALYQQLAGTGRTTNDISEAVNAARQGRLEFLFVSLGEEQWGTCGPLGERITVHEKSEPGDEDLLNVAAMHTILRGGVVFAVPPGDLPGGTLVAGIYWLPLAKR